MKIKNYCKHCKHIELEKKNIKNDLIINGKRFLIFLILFTSLMGSTGLYNFIVGNVWENPNQMLQLGESYAFFNNFRSNFQSEETKDKLTEISNELTEDCNNDECKARIIYNELITFDYLSENATNLNPIKTWESKKGDCDMMSYLYISLLKNQGIKSRLSCTQNHCWNIVYLEDKKVIADIVNYIWREV